MEYWIYFVENLYIFKYSYGLQQTIADEAVIDMKWEKDLHLDDEFKNDLTTDELVDSVNYVNYKTSSEDCDEF